MREPRYPRAGPAAGWSLTLARCASAIVFIAFGAGKFVDHASERASFEGYGLPFASVFVDTIGVVELAGGLLLLAGVQTRLTAAALAGDMVGAVIVSGLLHGERISLTLAPALLACMLVLIRLGPGRMTLGARRAGEGRHTRI